MPAPELVSEPIAPLQGSFNAAAMAQGEPGLPHGFTWRGRTYDVMAALDQWKHSEQEGARADGAWYLRRHYYKLRMSDDSIWTVYFIRQTPKSGSPKRRWFLYTIERHSRNAETPKRQNAKTPKPDRNAVSEPRP